MIKYHIRFALVLLPMQLLTGHLSAQTPQEEYDLVIQKFPTKDFAHTSYNWMINLEMKRGELLASIVREEEGICLTEKSVRFREGSVSQGTFMQIDGMEFKTRVPFGNKYKDVKVNDFTEYSMGGSAFYDDSKTFKYHWPQLSKGAKKYEKVSFKVNDPHFAPSFYTSAFVPILNGRFELNVGKGIEVEITPFNMEKLDARHERIEKRNSTVYTWEFSNYEGFKYESSAPDARRYVPHLLIRVKSYNNGGERVSVLGDIGDLHSWYCNMVNNSTQDDLTEVKRMVDSITTGIDGELEAAKMMYAWVQQNIEYVAIEDGYNGFQPERASRVCASRFGDCKGMSNLLHQMYGIYGLNSQLTWVGTRDISYTYDQVPTPAADNHMILILTHEGHKYFLDPTHSLLEFGVPSPFIQDKQTLTSYNCDSFELITVPVPPASNNMVDDTSHVRLEGNSVVGEGKALITGYQKMEFLRGLSKSDYDYLKKYCRDYLSRGSNKFVLDTVWLVNQHNRNLPLEVHYSYRINDYVKKNRDEKYINLNLELGSPPRSVEDDRVFPVTIGYHMRFRSHSILHLGEKEEVKSLPSDKIYDGENYDFEIRYTQSHNKVERTTIETYNYLELSPEEFDQWNDFVKAFISGRRESLIISDTQL